MIIKPILAKYAEEKKISLVLQKQNVVIGKSDLYITHQILKIVNEKINIHFTDGSNDIVDYLVVSDGVFSSTKSVIEKKNFKIKIALQRKVAWLVSFSPFYVTSHTRFLFNSN